MRKFKTESKRLLDLMINSIYTNEEIFLRELISNASDAIDKLYFKSLTDSSIEISRDDLYIIVNYSKDERTITISDSGIGMTEEELDKNLGTIAHSGSVEFVNESADQLSDDIDIIGQFGVGFYSGFMVSQNMKVVSRAYGAETAFAWTSDGVSGYTVSESQRPSHGTDVILTLRENTEDNNYDKYLSDYQLIELIRRYSNYIRYPILMEVTKSRELPKPEDADDDYQPQYEQYQELDTINSMVPIWKSAKSDVTKEDYFEFYKSNFHDFTNPLKTIPIHAEGTLTYDALLFIPGRAPYDFYNKDFQRGLALYSSGVLIMEKCEELIPSYFGFVRGVVDSQDLTLNISRETLQHNNQLRAVERKIERKIKSELALMRDKEREAYEGFFENFGRALKYGIFTSHATKKDLLSDLLLYYSAKHGKMITLQEYFNETTPQQDSIYYAAGESIERLSKMPITKTVLGKGYDVLLCIQDVDEFCFGAMVDYEEKAFKNIAGGDLGLESPEEKTQAEETAKENEELFSAMAEILDGKVARVDVSLRLSDAPAAITAGGAVSLEMEKILTKMQDGDGIKSERILEINVDHPIFATLKAAHESSDDEKLSRYTNLLYNQALLVEGMPIDDPVAFALAISELMV